MWKIILLVILLLIAAGFFIFRPSRKIVEVENSVGENGYLQQKANERTTSYTKYGFIPLGLAGLLVLMTSWTQVHAKEIGVGVAFGQPVAEYDSGLHFKPFWYSVTKINGTVYTDSYGIKGSGTDPIPVRLGDGNPASAAVSFRWHVNPAAVDYIYATYRSDDPAEQLRESVVDTQLYAVVNNVFSSFNPTASIQQLDTNDPAKAAASLNFSPDYTEMALAVKQQMLEAVKDSDGLPLVVIDKVTVSGVNYNDATESRIAGIMQQVAKTQQAIQLEATNQALSDANNKLKDSLQGKNGALVLVQQCLQDVADGKFVLPAGGSCWPNSGSGVVIPSATK